MKKKQYIYTITLLIGILCYTSIANSPIAFAQKKKEPKKKDVVFAKNLTPPEIEVLFTEALKYYFLEDYSTAVSLFNQLILQGVEKAGIFFYASKAHWKIGSKETAIEYAQNAIEQEPTNKYNYELLAQYYQQIGETEKALSTYEQMVQKAPNTELYYQYLAELYQEAGKNALAIQYYEKLEALYGVQKDFTRNKQKVYLKQNDIDNAIKEGQKLILNFPDEPLYLQELITILIENNRIDEAQKLIEQSLQQPYPNPQLYVLLCEIYLKKNEREKIIALLPKILQNPDIDPDTKVILLITNAPIAQTPAEKELFSTLAIGLFQKYPNNATLATLVGDKKVEEKKYKEALHYYLLAAQLGNNTQQHWVQILEIDSELALYDSLLKHTEEALSIYPNYAVFWLYNGGALLAQKKYEDAIDALAQTKKLSYGSVDLLTDANRMIGDAHQALQNYPQSDQAYEEALKANPNDVFTLNNYSYYLALRKQDLSKAIQLSEKLITLAPENPTYMDTRGWILYQNEQYKEAIPWLEKASQLTEDALIWEHYGDALFQINEIEKAIEQWLKAQKKGGASDKINQKIQEKRIVE